MERSQDSILNMGVNDNASDFLKIPEILVSSRPFPPCEATSASPTDGAQQQELKVQTHVCGVTAESVSLSLDAIRDAQNADDSLPVSYTHLTLPTNREV